MNLNDYIKLTLGVNIQITKAKIKKKNQNDLIKLSTVYKNPITVMLKLNNKAKTNKQKQPPPPHTQKPTEKGKHNYIYKVFIRFY